MMKKSVRSAVCGALGALCIALGAGAADLPAGYTAVEWIESTKTGNQFDGQFIDTGYIANGNTKVEFTALIQPVKGCVLFGSRTLDSWTEKAFALQMYEWNGVDSVRFAYNGDYRQATDKPFSYDDKVTVICDGNHIEWTGEKSAKVEFTANPLESSKSTLYIFADNSVKVDGGKCEGGYNLSALRLYSFKISEVEEGKEEVLKRDFTPCVRESDLAVGLYDLAESDPDKAFYANAGSGVFKVPEGTFCTVTVGAIKNMTAAYTFGTGTVTNKVNGESFRVVKGLEDVRVIFTADEGYVIDGNSVVYVNIGDESVVSIADAVPSAELRPAFVTVTSAKQRWPWNGKVDVGYTLSNTEEGEYYRLITAVTVDGTTRQVTNEVGAVSDGNYKTTVDCAALFGTGVLAPASITMAVRTYSVPAVKKKFVLDGPFMVIDLTKDKITGQFSHQEYATTAKLPPGAWHLETGWAADYKTKYLVMRKVEKGKAYPCEPTSGKETSNKMTPTNDYWIGVHQVTVAQYERVMTEGDSKSAEETPKNSISWNVIRSGDETETISPKAEVEENSFMGKLCKLTGLDNFDLPTEAQWEIAARAGSTKNYGSFIGEDGGEQEATTQNFGEIAWYGDNNDPDGVKVVGQKSPNLWGLYDTAGNVWEWCRDGLGNFNCQDVETPSEGYSSGDRVARGGCYHGDAYFCRPSYRSYGSARSAYDNIGFRLSRICDPDAK